MTPTWTQMYNVGIGPFMNREISIKEGLGRAEKPMREFMFRQTRVSDIELMLGLARTPVTENMTRKDVPTHILIAAFVISELTRSFTMGFILYLPFVIIDLVISTTLISMGMLVLPPILISLPFKILLFVLVDGWALVVRSMVASFY
jgi:flagellar biosynthetic protein FliP